MVFTLSTFCVYIWKEMERKEGVSNCFYIYTFFFFFEIKKRFRRGFKHLNNTIRPQCHYHNEITQEKLLMYTVNYRKIKTFSSHFRFFLKNLFNDLPINVK